MRVPLAGVGEALVLTLLQVRDQEDLPEFAPGTLGIRGGSHEDVFAEDRLALYQHQVVFSSVGDPLDGVLVDGLVGYFYRVGTLPAPALAVEKTPGGEIIRPGGGGPGEHHLLVESLDVTDAVDVESPRFSGAFSFRVVERCGPGDIVATLSARVGIHRLGDFPLRGGIERVGDDSQGTPEHPEVEDAIAALFFSAHVHEEDQELLTAPGRADHAAVQKPVPALARCLRVIGLEREFRLNPCPRPAILAGLPPEELQAPVLRWLSCRGGRLDPDRVVDQPRPLGVLSFRHGSDPGVRVEPEGASVSQLDRIAAIRPGPALLAGEDGVPFRRCFSRQLRLCGFLLCP